MKLQCILALLLIGTSCLGNELYKPINLGKHEIVFSSSSRNISSFDPTPTNNEKGSIFPGGRGANQLVIYTSKFGDRTNTNEFGTEAIINGNIVTIISGANSLIPQENGIVISGHGSAKKWMKDNIDIGTKIFIDKENNVVYAYTTSDSYLYEAEEKTKETHKIIDYYKGKAPNYAWRKSFDHIKEAEKHLKEAKRGIESEENLKKYTELALKEANQAILSALPNLKDELKGVWIRPTQTTEDSIINTLDEMQKIGLDNIFLETFYHGKTIFPSETMGKYGFITQRDQFKHFDPLKIWIEEAHKRDIKVHIWFQSFYVGNTPPANKNILAIKPAWGNKIKLEYKNATPTRSKSEHNGYFLDPANPDVQDFLTLLVDEIITKYQPDGINLDYIRYPQAISKTENGNWGYTEYARKNFETMYGTDPIKLKKEDKLWKDWDNYRREQITNFVRKIGALCRDKNTYVSAVIFPDLENALNTKQQDWRTWSRRGYINGLTPLFLTYDPKMVSIMMEDVQKIKASNTDLYAGLFVTFMDGDTEDLVRQIHETRKLKANGVILFDYAHTNIPKYTNMLKNSAFQNKVCDKKQEKQNKKNKKDKKTERKKFRFFKK